MKTYIITLARVPQRRAQMVRQCDALGLDYEIIDAVDGSALDERSRREMAAEQTSFRSGEIGCAYSHMLCYEKMLSENIPCAMILEDDAIIPEDITDILASLENVIGKSEVILLSSYSHRRDMPLELSSDQKQKLDKKYTLYHPVDYRAAGSGMAYVITLKAAEKIAVANTPMGATADNWGRFYELGCFDALRCLYPSPFKAAEFNSTIEYAASGSLMNRIAATVRRYRVPLLLSLLQLRDNLRMKRKLRVRIV